MKTKRLSVGLALSTLAVLIFAGVRSARAQGTAFTYQGRLNDNGAAASGSYDFRFRLAADALGNNLIGGPQLPNAIPVAGGLFTTTLDFGAGNFIGSNYWLQVEVKTNGAASYTTLTPLQALTPTPYAIFANTASNLSGTLASAQLSGALPSAQLFGTYSSAVTFSNAANNFSGAYAGNGGGLTNVSADTLGGFGADQLWKTAGNSNTIAGVSFLGTADGQPLDFRVNNGRALQLAPTTNTANFIGGDSHNFVAPGVYGATIGGGGTLAYPGGSGLTNKILANFATIGGGVGNTASGTSNRQEGDSATVGGGWGNSALGNNATVAGGGQNQVLGDDSAVGGGSLNTIQTNLLFGTISGGYRHNIGSGANFATIAGGGFNTIQADARSSTISGGTQNTIESGAIRSTLAGGIAQIIHTNAHHSAISGGEGNVIQANSDHSAIAGGYSNSIFGSFATIAGGDLNAAGTNGFAAGHRAKALHTGSFIWGDSQDADFSSTANNQFLIRAAGGVGIGTTSPGGTLDVRGDIRLGSSSQFYAPAAVENVRIIHGVISAAGAILAGQSFTVTRTGVGSYTVTFIGSFTAFPTVTVAAQAGVPRMATSTNVGNSSAQFRTFDAAGALVDAQFHFIAIGPR